VCPCFAQPEPGSTDEAELYAIIKELVEKMKSDDIETANSATEDIVRMTRDFIELVSTSAEKAANPETRKNLMSILDRTSMSLRGQLFVLRMYLDSRSKVEELSRSMPDIYDRIGDSHWKNRQELVVELTEKDDPDAVPILPINSIGK